MQIVTQKKVKKSEWLRVTFPRLLYQYEILLFKNQKKDRMKKLFYVFAIATISTFAACGGGEEKPAEETTPAETPATDNPAPAADDTTAAMPADTATTAQ